MYRACSSEETGSEFSPELPALLLTNNVPPRASETGTGPGRFHGEARTIRCRSWSGFGWTLSGTPNKASKPKEHLTSSQTELPIRRKTIQRFNTVIKIRASETGAGAKTSCCHGNKRLLGGGSEGGRMEPRLGPGPDLQEL
ncbi:hypothetical protein SRHO_G00312210 [Serrasalmus rhombeus]